jgi:DNA polymerase-3 subunit epsilon
MQPAPSTDAEDSSLLAYTSLLDRVLEDRHIDETEGEALVELATQWDITGDQIQRTHRDYLLRLGAAALADGVVTAAERRDLGQVACLLGVHFTDLDQMLEFAADKLAALRASSPEVAGALFREDLAGKRVCFTGESQCRLDGEPISRETAMELAATNGLIIAETVTKKLDLLVIADPLTLSGEAKKARQYGVRIVHEPVFWRALGLEVE